MSAKETRINNGEKAVSRESYTAVCKSMKLEHIFTPYRKINSKWLNNLNIRQDTIKLLEENIGKRFSDINRTNVFLDQYPKATEVIVKNKQIGPNQNYNLCTEKETINKRKRNLQNGRKYLQIM